MIPTEHYERAAALLDEWSRRRDEGAPVDELRPLVDRAAVHMFLADTHPCREDCHGTRSTVAR